jgi:hypothetical protein
MFAKGVGIIGIGQAKTKCETLKPNDPDRIGKFYESNAPEWRVPVEWVDWRSDEEAYHCKSPNFTFLNVKSDQYSDMREGIRKHYLGGT